MRKFTRTDVLETNIIRIFYLIILSSLFLLIGCNDEETAEVPNGWVRVLPLELAFPASGGSQDVNLILTDDIDPANLQCRVAANGEEWCSFELVGQQLKVTVDPTYYQQPRSTLLTLTHGTLKREIPIEQAASAGSEDTKIRVTAATATSEETEAEPRGIAMSYDGDYTTYFNSKFGAITEWPFAMEYTLQSGSTLNYLIYHPRSDSGNKWGAFNEYEVWVSTQDVPAFTKVGTYKRGDANFEATVMKLETPVKNVSKVRFVIHSAYQSRISCAEMEFFQTSNNKYDYLKIFTDDACSELRPEVTEKEIKKIPDAQYKQLATALLNQSYNAAFRVANYRPYQNPTLMANANKTSTYSLRDNPTGIYVAAGEELLVLVGDTHGQNLSLVIQDLEVGYGSSKTIALQEGGNKVKVTSGGLVYIQNLTNDPLPLLPQTEADKAAIAAKTVKIHFAFGKVNGYFDIARHNAADWTELLRNAKYKDLDVLGKYAHITWKTQDFKDFNTDIVTSIRNYDDLVYREQEFMGLVKYHKMFNNRMYFHIDYKGASPYSSAYRTAYTPGYAEIFCNAARFGARLWGPAHEVGHSNQTRPGLKWAGTTEVTNNILSMYIQQQFGEKSKLIADGTYAAATKAIIDAEQPHCLDNGSSEFILKLVPFWQLKLYMVDALGKEDFYKDLYEHYRTTANLSTADLTDGVLQLDFVRQVCRISGLDMTDFFSRWGFLRPVDKVLNDYGNKPLRITQPQIDALIKEIKARNYATPHARVHQITEENVQQYK